MRVFSLRYVGLGGGAEYRLDIGACSQLWLPAPFPEYLEQGNWPIALPGSGCPAQLVITGHSFYRIAGPFGPDLPVAGLIMSHFAVANPLSWGFLGTSI